MRTGICLFAAFPVTVSLARQNRELFEAEEGGEGSVYTLHKGTCEFYGGFCVTVMQTHSRWSF